MATFHKSVFLLSHCAFLQLKSHISLSFKSKLNCE